MCRPSRELLPAPLPFAPTNHLDRSQKLGRPVQRRILHRKHFADDCNNAVDALNNIFGSSTPDSSLQPSAAQSVCLDGVVDVVQKFGKPPSDLSATGSLQEICGARVGYCMEPDIGPHVSYEPGRQALPPLEDRPVSFGHLLHGVARSQWLDWENQLLQDPAAAKASILATGLAKPYTDPKLVRSQSNYAFVQATFGAPHHLL